MYVKTVELWEKTPGICEETPTLDIYIPQKKTSQIGIVIFSGGGYFRRSAYEGKGYAEFLNEHGITAFVCQYRVRPHEFPLPLLDARRAVRYVRRHREEFGIKQVFVMGSSAGGHLAALTCTYRKPIEFEGADELDTEEFLPDGQILCYPVIALLGENTHLVSGKSLLGERQEEMGDALSPHLIADEATPKAFLWHTFGDPAVSVLNTLQYAHRLWEVGVSVDVHIYPDGGHGLGLATHVPHTRSWTRELLEWLETQDDALA